MVSPGAHLKQPPQLWIGQNNLHIHNPRAVIGQKPKTHPIIQKQAGIAVKTTEVKKLCGKPRVSVNYGAVQYTVFSKHTVQCLGRDNTEQRSRN